MNAQSLLTETLLQTAMDGYWLNDLQGRLLEVNETYCQMSGYSRAELLTMRISHLEVVESPDEILAHINKLKATGAVRFESKHRRKDASIYDVEVSAKYVPMSAGERTVAFLRDITERKRDEASLRESQERLQQLVEHMADGVAVYREVDEGRDFAFVDLNRSGQALSRIRLEDVIGRRVTEVFPAVASMGLLDLLRRVWRTGQPEHHPLTAYKDDRIEQWVENYVYKLPSGLLVAIYSDKSEAYRGEATRQILSSIVESSDDAMISKSLDGTIRSWNKGAELLYGFSASEMLGQSISRLVPPDRQDEFPGIMERLSCGEHLAHYETERLTKDGRRVQVSLTISPLKDQAGRVVGASAVARDITARKQQEAQQALLEAELLQAQKMEALGRLAGGVAHDFNNHLAVILGYAEMLMKKAGSKSLRQYAKYVITSARKSAELTRQLLTFARKGELATQPVDIHVLIDETLALLRRSISKKIRLHRTFGADWAVVLGDAALLQNTLFNLAINARDAMPRGGKLTIRTAAVDLDEARLKQMGATMKAGTCLEVLIADTGCGMDEAVRRRAFEPFFTTKPDGQGTGLGLALVYSALQRFGGHVTLESTPGKGTTFRLYFPLAPKTNTSKARKAKNGSSRSPRKLRVLVVDDERLCGHLVSDLLKDLGCKAVCRQDGAAALAYYRSHWPRIELVILDLNMPGMTGAETFAALRQVNPEARIIMASGLGDDAQVKQLLERGAVGFLAKPFDPGMIEEQVTKVIMPSPPRGGALRQAQGHEQRRVGPT